MWVWCRQPFSAIAEYSDVKNKLIDFSSSSSSNRPTSDLAYSLSAHRIMMSCQEHVEDLVGPEQARFFTKHWTPAEGTPVRGAVLFIHGCAGWSRRTSRYKS